MLFFCTGGAITESKSHFSQLKSNIDKKKRKKVKSVFSLHSRGEHRKQGSDRATVTSVKTYKEVKNFVATRKQATNSKRFGADQVLKALENKEEIMATLKRKKILRPQRIP